MSEETKQEALLSAVRALAPQASSRKPLQSGSDEEAQRVLFPQREGLTPQQQHIQKIAQEIIQENERERKRVLEQENSAEHQRVLHQQERDRGFGFER